MVKCPHCGEEIPVEEYIKHYDEHQKSEEETRLDRRLREEREKRAEVGSILLKKASDLMDEVKRDYEGYKAKKITKEIVRENYGKFNYGLSVIGAIAEELGLVDERRKIDRIISESVTISWSYR